MENNLNLKFHSNTSIVERTTKTLFNKAIDRNGKFVWIDKEGFPKEEDRSFYLTIIRDLNGIDIISIIANSFNLFYSRQDFYSQYTFVKEVKL